MDVEEVIRNNMGLAYAMLDKFNMRNDQDAESLALEALWRATTTYNGAIAKFSTYASVCIYNALGGHLRRLNKKRKIDQISYETPITDSLVLLDVLGNGSLPEDVLLTEELQQLLQCIYERVLAEAPTKSAKLVIEHWYVSCGTARQGDLAALTGLTQSYVSRVISAARYKFRKALEEYLCP